MSKKDEALKLALEALKLNNAEWKSLADSGDAGIWRAEDQPHYKQTEAAITAIEELSEQPAQQQEPYGWKVYGVNSLFMGEFAEADAKAEAKRIGGTCIAFPLYTSSPASKPLTDEQITAGARALCKQMAEACGVDVRDQWQLYSDTFKEDAKAVLEAAHGIKEKNT